MTCWPLLHGGGIPMHGGIYRHNIPLLSSWSEFPWKNPSVYCSDWNNNSCVALPPGLVDEDNDLSWMIHRREGWGSHQQQYHHHFLLLSRRCCVGCWWTVLLLVLVVHRQPRPCFVLPLSLAPSFCVCIYLCVCLWFNTRWLNVCIYLSIYWWDGFRGWSPWAEWFHTESDDILARLRKTLLLHGVCPTYESKIVSSLSYV